MEGPDHQFALEPNELERMVSAIRDTETALGTGKKYVLEVEEELHEKARRAVHAVKDIDAGELFTPDNVKILRPGVRETGLPPKFYDDVVGENAAESITAGEGIQWDDVKN